MRLNKMAALNHDDTLLIGEARRHFETQTQNFKSSLSID